MGMKRLTDVKIEQDGERPGFIQRIKPIKLQVLAMQLAE
jgi:hypothetical protein